MDCGDGVLLGKPRLTTHPGASGESFGFSALRGGGPETEWAADRDAAAALDHFLMLHRGHELRVLAETAGDLAAKDGFPTGWPDLPDDPDPAHDRRRFLDRDPGRPDPVAETEALPEHVKARIAEF